MNTSTRTTRGPALAPATTAVGSSMVMASACANGSKHSPKQVFAARNSKITSFAGLGGKRIATIQPFTGGAKTASHTALGGPFPSACFLRRHRHVDRRSRLDGEGPREGRTVRGGHQRSRLLGGPPTVPKPGPS